MYTNPQTNCVFRKCTPTLVSTMGGMALNSCIGRRTVRGHHLGTHFKTQTVYTLHTINCVLGDDTLRIHTLRHKLCTHFTQQSVHSEDVHLQSCPPWGEMTLKSCIGRRTVRGHHPDTHFTQHTVSVHATQHTQGKAGQGRAGQGKAGQGKSRAEQSRAGQGRAGHYRARQGRAGAGARQGRGRGTAEGGGTRQTVAAAVEAAIRSWPQVGRDSGSSGPLALQLAAVMEDGVASKWQVHAFARLLAGGTRWPVSGFTAEAVRRALHGKERRGAPGRQSSG